MPATLHKQTYSHCLQTNEKALGSSDVVLHEPDGLQKPGNTTDVHSCSRQWGTSVHVLEVHVLDTKPLFVTASHQGIGTYAEAMFQA